jgi:outer membrane protein assembly factor BamD (BamD/ComL family)
MESNPDEVHKMMNYKGLTAVWLALTAIFVLPSMAAETWHLSSQKGWESVSDSPEAQFLLAISKIKQQIDTGSSKEALQAMETLKTDYPQFAGPALDLYIEAEQLYIKGNLSKAAKQYTRCLSEYPDSPLQAAISERLYSIGTAYASGQKRVFIKILRFPAHDEGEKILRDLADRGGDSPLSYRSLLTVAENQERRKLYLDAYQTWAEIADRWPTGPTGQQALLRMAQSLHAAYRSPDYDVTVLRGAASYFEDYKNRYEASAKELEIDKTLDLIVEQQAYKSFFVGLYYEKVEKIEPALMYYRTVVDGWPESRAAEMARRHLEALEKGDSLLPPKGTRRKLADLGARFLDKWFGLSYILNLPTGEETAPAQSEEKTSDS